MRLLLLPRRTVRALVAHLGGDDGLQLEGGSQLHGQQIPQVLLGQHWQAHAVD